MKITHYFITIFITINFLGCKSKESTNVLTPLSESSQKLSDILKNKTVDTRLIDSVLYHAFNVAQTHSSKTHDSLIAATCRQIGNVFLDNGQYDKACQYYKKGLNYGTRHLKESDEIIARLYHNIGLAYFNLDDFKSSIKYCDSIQIESLEKPLLTVKANKLQRLATCYYYLKDYKSSERMFQEAIPMAKLYLTNQNIAYIYTKYANCLRALKRYQESINASEISINILKDFSKIEKLSKKDSINLAGGYFGVARALQDSGVYLSAEKYYNEALTIFKQINDIDNYSGGLLNMGLMFRYNKELAKAEKTLTDGIQLLNQQVVLSDYLWVRKGKFYINRSEVFFEKKQCQKALTDQDSAIFYLTKYGESPSLNTLLLSNRYSLLSVYSDKAKINMLLAENGQDTEGYQKSLTVFNKIIELADDIRADYFSDEAKLTLATDAKPALEKAIAVCQKLYLKTKDKQYLEQAFGFVEYSKSMVLYENTRLENHLTPALKARGEALKQKEGELIAKNDVEKLQAYLRDKRQYREDIKALNKNTMASVGDLQKALLPNNQTALIEYFVGDSAIFVFSLLQNDLILNELPKTKDFDKQIDALRTEITEHKAVHDATRFEAQSYALYQYLLKQTLDTLPKNLHQLIIVPDGVLNYLPFEVLVSDAAPLKNNSSFLRSKFLVRDYTISYAYSANLLLEQKGMKKDAPELFAGFASQYADKDTTFAYVSETRAALTRAGAYKLNGTKEEVNQISTLLGGKPFIDAACTEGAFKKDANRYKILHFAMHSLTDDKDASLSRLLFTLTPQDTTNDNDLTAAELHTMQLNADLAVLSACNTGFGTLNKGEGVMSLARAFFYAGVPSTVTSLWEVDDSKTRDIMIDFYKNLKKGMTKDQALCEAKRDYLINTTESGTANPYFWAGFVPIGNMNAMDLSEKRSLSIWGILAGFVALSGLGIWFWERRTG